MTNKQLDNRVKKLQGIEAQLKELEAQAEAIRAEIKADLENKGEDEHDTGSFIIRWKEIISRRLDGKPCKTLRAAIEALRRVRGKPLASAPTKARCKRPTQTSRSGLAPPV